MEAPIRMLSLNTPDMDVSLCDYVVNVYTHIGILFFYTKLLSQKQETQVHMKCTAYI
jgi:hypothetical protein